MLRWLPSFVTGGLVVAALIVGADALVRVAWGEARTAHVAAALALYVPVTTLVALAVAALLAAARAATERVEARWAWARRRALPLLGAAVAIGSLGPTIFWVFTGERIRHTAVAGWAPYVLLAGCAAGGWFGVVLVQRVVRARTGTVVALAGLLSGVALVLVWIDLTVYVSLYARLHALLEGLAALALWVSAALVLRLLVAVRGGGQRALQVIAGLAGLVTLAFLALESLRVWADETLRHAWREPVYVGRMLSRLHIAEGFVRDPVGWRGATLSSVVRLRERYDIATTARSRTWDQPLNEPAWLRERLTALRGPTERNVVVFYVDTLRADVAHDGRTMPTFGRFAEESLDFRRAYTTGSDTLHALPGITGGSYDLFAEAPNDLLRVSDRAGFRQGLAVAQSAREFLERLLPGFVFRETLEVPDYATGNDDVWGYGADQPTSPRIVDRALDWMRDRKGERFFLWMFHFDLHNWRELDEPHVRALSRQHRILDEAEPTWRYRVVARSIDAQFERLLRGLGDLGLTEDTVVLFVSDHGEALGRGGFWVHSVFLWESLVRVPLALRVPGVAPERVDEAVSLVDVAPTLARFMVPNAETAGYDGEDLLSYVVPGHPPRRHPLVMMSTLKEVPVRIGLIDPIAPWKLVLPFDGAVPELYDLEAADPDERDVSGEHPVDLLRLLNQLVRAPLFPRAGEAGSGPLDLAAREARH